MILYVFITCIDECTNLSFFFLGKEKILLLNFGNRLTKAWKKQYKKIANPIL